MINKKTLEELQNEFDNIKNSGTQKIEYAIEGLQGGKINVNNKPYINMCSNNYLGLASSSLIIEAAKAGLGNNGFGMGSVRFICGTQTIHLQLEQELAKYFRTESTILYGSCFDANGGLFEIILNEQDAIVSDSLNHASIIDGIRLCKAKRYRYENNDLSQLENSLKNARESGARRVMIATDGVFSMDGTIANLNQICDLAEKYSAIVMVDDCHGSGFLGKTGRGSVEHCGVEGRVDIITSTLGKALGGASGGFSTGKKEIIDLLRQRSRPYLFSNSLAPCIVQASLETLRILSTESKFREKLLLNTTYYRNCMLDLGFSIKGQEHPIVPVMVGDEMLTYKIAKAMFEYGVYVVGIVYPVVPKGQGRIRSQISAAHEREDLDFAIEKWQKVGKEFGLI